MQELSKAERAALFKHQHGDQARIDAQKVAKECAKPSKKERAAQQEAQRAAKTAVPGKKTSAASGAAPPPAPAAEEASGWVAGAGVHDWDVKGITHAAESARSFVGQVVVLVSHGSFNPVHRDHLNMMVRARKAMEEVHGSASRSQCKGKHDEELLVLGVFGIARAQWLQAKGLAPDEQFSDEVRVKMLELATAEEDWLFVADSALSTSAVSSSSMIKMLTAKNAFPRESTSKPVRFVRVMGSDLDRARLGPGYHREQGLFVADRDEKSGHSSTKVREALAEGNRAYLEKALPPAVLRNLPLVLGLETEQREATKQETSAASDVAALLRISTVSEVEARAAKARQENSERGRRARVAFETLNILAAGGYWAQGSLEWVDISRPVELAVDASSYHSEMAWRWPGLPPAQYTDVEVDVMADTVLAASQLLALVQQTAPGALNFASARNPGGGFTTGAQAQEESIARSSALYPCLSKHHQSFFVPQRQARSGAYSHDMIFSPSVPVIRDSSGQLLDKPYVVHFLTSAAPNVGSMRRDLGDKAEREAEIQLRERIGRVLALFVAYGVSDVVLGAWGCGVFGNDPKMVSEIFAAELRGRFRRCFRRVVFAVTDAGMAHTFGSTFGVQVQPPTSDRCGTASVRRLVPSDGAK